MLIPIRETWTIIILGKWNVAIFSPNWLSKNVFHEQEMTMEFTVEPSNTRRITARGISLQPQSGRLVLGLSEISLEALSRLEATACALLDKLPHTPVSQTGINFGFRIDEPEQALLDHFQFVDGNWFADHEMSSTSRVMGRSLEIDEGVLNLKVEIKASAIDIHFNFHSETPSAGAAKEAIQGKVANLKEKAEFVLQDLYNLEMEEA